MHLPYGGPQSIEEAHMDELDEYVQHRQPAPFVTLRCCDCEHTFADRMPPLHENMPECPLCGSGPVQLVELLEPADS